MSKIPILVIALLDLKNTTEKVPEIQTLLKDAHNDLIDFYAVKMEYINQVYYRHINLGLFKGIEYKGQTDDTRAMRNFIAAVFETVKPILPGRESITILHSSDYEKEAKILELLIDGQELNSFVMTKDDFLIDVD